MVVYLPVGVLCYPVHLAKVNSRECLTSAQIHIPTVLAITSSTIHYSPQYIPTGGVIHMTDSATQMDRIL